MSFAQWYAWIVRTHEGSNEDPITGMPTSFPSWEVLSSYSHVIPYGTILMFVALSFVSLCFMLYVCVMLARCTTDFIHKIVRHIFRPFRWLLPYVVAYTVIEIARSYLQVHQQYFYDTGQHAWTWIQNETLARS